MLVEGLQSFLAADAGVKAAVGGTRRDKTTGIFPTIAPDSCPVPYVVMQQVSGNSLEESFAGTGRLQTQRWRFSCYGADYKSAKTLAKALRLALMGADGALPAGNAEVHGVWQQLEADDAEEIPHGTIYATHVDFDINFRDGDS